MAALSGGYQIIAAAKLDQIGPAAGFDHIVARASADLVIVTVPGHLISARSGDHIEYFDIDQSDRPHVAVFAAAAAAGAGAYPAPAGANAARFSDRDDQIIAAAPHIDNCKIHPVAAIKDHAVKRPHGQKRIIAAFAVKRVITGQAIKPVCALAASEKIIARAASNIDRIAISSGDIVQPFNPCVGDLVVLAKAAHACG